MSPIRSGLLQGSVLRFKAKLPAKVVVVGGWVGTLLP